MLAAPAHGIKPPQATPIPYEAGSPPVPEPAIRPQAATFVPGIALAFAEPLVKPAAAIAVPTVTPFLPPPNALGHPVAHVVEGPLGPAAFPEPVNRPPPATIGPWIVFPEPNP
jgi:hypothetical protein